MKVILKEDIPRLGRMGESVQVAPGYGRNYLIPQGKAILASSKNLKALEHEQMLIQRKADLVRKDAEGLAGKISGLTLPLARKVIDEDKLMSIVLEAGAEDMKSEETTYAVTTQPGDLYKVKKALENNNVTIEAAEVTNVPKSTVKIIGDDAQKVLALVNEIEENDDVQNVYANFDIPDNILKQLENAG